MNASQILPMLLGAALVALGVIAGAVADRIRGVRAARASSPRVANAKRDVIDISKPPAEEALGVDVQAALVQAGFPRGEAMAATRNTPRSQRSTLESWTRGALALLRAS